MKLSNIKNLAIDSVIYGFSGMFIKLIGFILFPLFARKFNAEIYGVIGVLNSLNLVLMTIAGLGLEGAATRWFFDKEDAKFKKSIFSTWLTGQLLTTFLINVIVIIFLKNWLSTEYLKVANGSLLIVIISSNLFLSILPSILNSYFILNKKPVGTLITNSSIVILSGLSSLLFVYQFNWGVTGFYLGQSVGFFIVTIVGLIFYINNITTFKFDFKIWKEMAKYGMKIIPANLSNQFLLFCAILIIQPLTSQSSLGYFQVAYTLAAAITLFTGGFGQAFVPYALSIDDTDFKKFTILVFDLYCGLMSFICFCLVIFYEELINLLLTPQYLNSEIPAGILTFGNFLISINSIASITLIKRKKIGYFARIILVYNIFCLILINILTKKLGIEGAALSFLIVQGLSVITVFFFSHKFMPVKYNYLKNFSTVMIFISAYLLFVYKFKQIEFVIELKLALLFSGIIFLFIFNLNSIKKLYALILNKRNANLNH